MIRVKKERKGWNASVVKVSKNDGNNINKRREGRREMKDGITTYSCGHINWTGNRGGKGKKGRE